MFTSREWEYLKKLEERENTLILKYGRGSQEWYDFDPRKPLEIPMKVEERKIRSSIRRKMTINAKELAYAFHCHMPPAKPVFQAGVMYLDTFVLLFKGLVWLDSLKKRGDLKEIIETRYYPFKMECEFGSAGKLVAREAARLRERFREKDPAIFDEIERKIDEERKKLSEEANRLLLEMNK